MKSFIRLGLIAALVVLAGCNTMRGIGQDIEKLGSTIEGAAKK